jgi:uncharacterized protein (TIGR03663 family)
MQRSLDLDRPVLGRVRLEHALHLSLLLLAAALRLVWLDGRPLHHDESIHAYYSWRILTYGPSDYRYDPVYHGPALYYLTAIWQGLLGPSDGSVRMLAAVTGFGLVALAWPLRTLIGRREALCYAALVTLSPTLGYYSRSLRHDVPYAFFVLAGVVAFLHFVRSGRWRDAYLAGVAAGLAAATKEDVYLSAFVFANALWLVGLVRLESSSLSIGRRAAQWASDVWWWLRRSWIPTATAVLIALTIALVLYTSLLTQPGEWNATARALRYWWGQHEKQRIGGPWWYYLPLEIGYEALIFLPAAAMFARCLVRGAGSRVQALFLVWSGLAFALYAWAQEKVPWLLIPVLLPQTVLAAHWLARRSARQLLWGSPLVAFTVWSLVCSNYLYDAPRTSEPPATAHFEPLVYVQSTYDVPAILSEIDAATRALGTGKSTQMVVVGDATWPLSWYLREYPVHWNSLPRQTNAPILVVDADDAPRLQKDLGDRYTAKRFALRGWWQIEWDEMTPRTLLRFLAERRVWNPTGTTDAVLLLAKDLSPRAVLPTVALHAPPTAREYPHEGLPSSGRRVGGPGAGPGEFAEPRGLAVDRDGALLVADSGNNRIQKLAPDGKVLAVWGGPSAGSEPGQFRQPCGVGTGPDGSIYVADTWNHRIVKLHPTGRFELEWREDEQGLWGPRAVVVSAEGTVFVADTGNKRILAYDSTGNRLFVFGGDGNEPGKLVEPVGLAIDAETGTLYVADTGNRRIEAFDLEGRYRAVLPVFGWEEFYTEPYLAWNAGTLWVTDSFNRRVNAYDARGVLLRSIDGSNGSPLLERPTGIAVADGRVYVSDVAGGFLAELDTTASSSIEQPYRRSIDASRVEMSPSSPTIASTVRSAP